MADFVAKFTEPKAFSFKFVAKPVFSVKFGNLGSGFDLKFGGVAMSETYKGAYNVVPSVNKQVMETANKYMSKNVNVMGVPIHITTNEKGGNTVHIATYTPMAILGSARLGEAVL
jgi:hypothetical protein